MTTQHRPSNHDRAAEASDQSMRLGKRFHGRISSLKIIIEKKKK